MVQQDKRFTERQMWILSESQRVVSYWRVCSQMSASDCSTALEVLEVYDDEVLEMAFRLAKKSKRSEIRQVPGIMDLRESAEAAKRTIGNRERNRPIPVERQLEMTEEDRQARDQYAGMDTSEFFAAMRQQFGVGPDDSKSGMTSAGDTLRSSPPPGSAAD